jgi:hypothetical protein
MVWHPFAVLVAEVFLCIALRSRRLPADLAGLQTLRKGRGFEQRNVETETLSVRPPGQSDIERHRPIGVLQWML